MRPACSCLFFIFPRGWYWVCEIKSILHMYKCGTRKSHPKDRNNSSETRLCRVSDEIIQVRGWDFLVLQQYIMMDTFSRHLCEFLRFYMNFVSSTYFFRFFAFVPITNQFSRCRNGCKHSLAPKNGSEIAFQASVWLLLGFETNVGISIY